MFRKYTQVGGRGARQAVAAVQKTPCPWGRGRGKGMVAGPEKKNKIGLSRQMTAKGKLQIIKKQQEGVQEGKKTKDGSWKATHMVGFEDAGSVLVNGKLFTVRRCGLQIQHNSTITFVSRRSTSSYDRA